MTHPSLDQLLNSCLEFAKEMLQKNKEFYPFGASIDSSKIEKLNASYTGDDFPDSKELINLLGSEYLEEAKAGNLEAAAICSNVHIALPASDEKSDAILVSLEHRNGESVDVYLPYDVESSSVSYGEIFSSSRRQAFFTE